MLSLLRRSFFPLLFGVAYVVLLNTIFFGETQLSDIGTTIGLQITLLILLLLSIVDIPSKYKNSIYLTILIASIISGAMALVIQGHQTALFVLCSHLILLIYAWQVFDTKDSSRSQSQRKIANGGLSLISVGFAITYSLTIRGAGSGISINCEDLQMQTLGLISHYIPSLGGNSIVLGAVQNIEKISSQTLGQILGTEKVGSGLLLISEYNMIPKDTNQTGGLFSSLIGYQESFIQGVLSNQELIDAKVCDFALGHIKQVMAQTNIQLIGFVLITLLLVFFMRSVMIVVGIISFILLRILFTLKRFTITKRKEDCEIIE